MKSTISLAAEAPNLYAAARLYAAMGFSVLPCKGKQPALKQWEHLQRRPAVGATIDIWKRVGLLENIGLICGAVSGSLAVVDLDGAEAVAAFQERWPDLWETYRVKTGHGMHLYYRYGYQTRTARAMGTRIGNIELRVEGLYVIAPPSIHPTTGEPYAVANPADILFVPTLWPVEDWIKSLIADKHGGQLPPAANAPVIHATAYGRAALMGECDKVRAAEPGSRNTVLYEAALRLGSLIHDGKLDRHTAEHGLLAAAGALTVTDGARATWRTIESGLNTGVENSRDQHRRA